MRPPTWIPLLLVVLLTQLCGCRNAFGPEQPPTTSVSGRVHLGEIPLTQGWVEMVPVDGTLGRLCSAAISSDGTFSAVHVPVGRIGVRLAGPRPPSTNDRIVEQFVNYARQQSMIRLEIKADANPPLDLDLRREAQGWRDRSVAIQKKLVE